MAGKKMKDDRGEKLAAEEARERTRIFSCLVKIEYDGKAVMGSSGHGSANVSCFSSSCLDSIWGFDMISFGAVSLTGIKVRLQSLFDPDQCFTSKVRWNDFLVNQSSAHSLLVIGGLSQDSVTPTFSPQPRIDLVGWLDVGNCAFSVQALKFSS